MSLTRFMTPSLSLPILKTGMEKVPTNFGFYGLMEKQANSESLINKCQPSLESRGGEYPTRPPRQIAPQPSPCRIPQATWVARSPAPSA